MDAWAEGDLVCGLHDPSRGRLLFHDQDIYPSFHYVCHGSALGNCSKSPRTIPDPVRSAFPVFAATDRVDLEWWHYSDWHLALYIIPTTSFPRSWRYGSGTHSYFELKLGAIAGGQ